MKELPADAFVENVVELLVSSGQPVSLQHAKKLLKRTITKLPDGRAKSTAQSQLPKLKRLLKKKLQDALPAAAAPKTKDIASTGINSSFFSAVEAGGSLPALLQARIPAHPALLERVLSQQDGPAFDQRILRIMAASAAPDVGHVINHACQRYSYELRQMAELCIDQGENVQGKGGSPSTVPKLCLNWTSSSDADSGRLTEICKSLSAVASLVPLRLAQTQATHGILHNACPPPSSPIPMLVFTAATAQVLAGWQQLQETWLPPVHLQQAVMDTEHHVRRLAAGLRMDPATTDSFLLQHPVTEIETCLPSQPWAAVPSVAWLSVHAATSMKRHRACPSLSAVAVLLQRHCSLRHACLSDSSAADKAAAALAGRPCSAAACAWVEGLQQPARFVAAVQRQDASQPHKLGNFLLTYPHSEDISHLQRLLLRTREPEARAAEANRDDDALFVLDSHADPVFTGAWAGPGGSTEEDEGSEGSEALGEENARGDAEPAEDDEDH